MTAISDGYRIDVLARYSGIASGTIRFYQREGLIPPPERRGRVAYYRESHLERLGRIRALQAQGLPLALIRDLLEREDAGQDISPWLELDRAVFSPRPSDDLRARLLAAKVPPSTLDAGTEGIEQRLHEVAEIVADLGWEMFEFDRRRLADGDPEAAREVLARFEEMRSLAQEMVRGLFARLLDDAVRRRSEEFVR